MKKSRNYTEWCVVKFDLYLYCMADTEILLNYGSTYLQRLEERQIISRFTSTAPQIQIQGARSFGIYGIGNTVFWFLHIYDKLTLRYDISLHLFDIFQQSTRNEYLWSEWDEPIVPITEDSKSVSEKLDWASEHNSFDITFRYVKWVKQISSIHL